MDTITSIGRRKAAIARIYLDKGNGSFVVNGKDFKEYFPVDHLRARTLEPLQALEATGSYDIRVNVAGGGVKGQAEAVALGIARALVKVDEENKPALKAKSLLTRDSRKVERKKPGYRKARKKEQYSKR